VQADHLGRLACLEVAAHGVSDLFVEGVDRVGLGEDRKTEGSSDVPALGCLLDQEDHFTHLRGHEASLPAHARLVTR